METLMLLLIHLWVVSKVGWFRDSVNIIFRDLDKPHHTLPHSLPCFLSQLWSKKVTAEGGSPVHANLKSPNVCALCRSQIFDRLLGELLDFLDVVFTAVSILNGGVDVGRGTNVRIVQHGDHWEDDALNAEDRSPSLISCLAWVKLISSRRVKNWDTDLPVRVDYREMFGL